MQHWTTENLELVYELLRSTKPFKSWKLPHPDELEFHSVRMRGQDQADCVFNGTRHVIRIACNKHAGLASLTATMAHEMLHLHLDRAYPRDHAQHGRRFKQHADMVCRAHSFDRGQF